MASGSEETALPRPIHTADNQIPEIGSREAFFDYADSILKGIAHEDMGIAYLRLLNVGNYSLREGIGAGDELIEVFTQTVIQHAEGDVIARGGGASFMVIVDNGLLVQLLGDIAEALRGFDPESGVQLKCGYCPMYVRYNAREIAERAHFAFDDIRYTDDKDLRVFDEAMSFEYDRRRYIIDCLDEAIERGEIHAFVQPIVRIVTGRVCEVEILSRWQSESFGLISPMDFVPLLEQFRQVHKLDATVIRLACKQWREASSLGIAVPFGINLSRLDFELCDIYRVVRDCMREYGVPVDMLHIEVTESAQTGREDLLHAGIKQFRDAGFKVYMDDYGTGYSSLAGMLSRNYDVVKLDKSLIDNVAIDERSRVIVADAVSMSKRLGMQTLCEGVETLEQLLFLRAVGCEKGQGYFFGRPADHTETMALLVQEAERHDEGGYDTYLDKVGRVNLIDGTRVDLQGVEAAAFVGVMPVATIEACRGHLYCLASNTAFTDFLRKAGAGSFEEAVSRISGGDASMRRRFEAAAMRARDRGKRQYVDFVAGGLFSTISIEHIAGTSRRNAYLVKASSVGSSKDVDRERSLEAALPFLLTIYKRIDLFDLESGTSKNLYLSAPLLRSYRRAGVIIDEIREFCDRNVHPADRQRFMNFYDLSSLNERVQSRGGHRDAISIRTRTGIDSYAEHVYTLIPMAVNGKRQVLSTLREVDVGSLNSFQSSGDVRISDAVLLDAVMEGIDRYVFWKDTHRRFLGANQAFLEYYGLSSLSEILGKTDEEIGWHDVNQPFRDDELRVLQGEMVKRVRGTCYSRNELRIIETNKRPIIVGGEVVGLLGYFRDLGPAEEEFRP